MIKSGIRSCLQWNAIVFKRHLATAIDSTSVSTSNQKSFSYEVKQERLNQIAKSPSGWVPRGNPEFPFDIDRTRTNNLPVYVSAKSGGRKLITTVRKIRGDLKELERIIRLHLGDNYHYQINELTSQIHIKGNHKDKLIRLLKELEF